MVIRKLNNTWFVKCNGQFFKYNASIYTLGQVMVLAAKRATAVH